MKHAKTKFGKNISYRIILAVFILALLYAAYEAELKVVPYVLIACCGLVFAELLYFLYAKAGTLIKQDTHAKISTNVLGALEQITKVLKNREDKMYLGNTDRYATRTLDGTFSVTFSKGNVHVTDIATDKTDVYKYNTITDAFVIDKNAQFMYPVIGFTAQTQKLEFAFEHYYRVIYFLLRFARLEIKNMDDLIAANKQVLQDYYAKNKQNPTNPTDHA